MSRPTEINTNTSYTEPQRSSLRDPLLSTEAHPRDGLNENEETAIPGIDQLEANIKKILALTWFSFTGRSIWSQCVLSIFVYLLRGDKPESVGYVTAIMGLSQVLASWPAGCLARKWQRSTILKMSSVFGLGAVGLTAYATWKLNFYYLLIALSLWGALWGVTDTALPSLFLDSIPDGEEKRYFRRGSRIIRSANFLGPLIALIIYQFLGNQWTIPNCSIVMGAGLVFCTPIIFILCCLRDYSVVDIEFEPPEEILIQSPVHFGSDDQSREGTYCCQKKTIVPILITIADIISGIASGMSIRYFPVFFVKQLGLSPASTLVLYMITPFGQGVFAFLARRLAKLFGPSCVAVVFHWAFVAFLASMLYCYLQGLSVWIICLLYVVHASLMNSTCSLSKLIMLQTVPEEEIHKWTMVEKIQLFLWSAGAAVGGILVGYKGILFNFFVTAALQLSASLPLILLCCLGTNADMENEEDPFSPPMLTEDEENGLSSIAEEDSADEEIDTVFEDSRTHFTLDRPESVFYDCSSLLTTGSNVRRIMRMKLAMGILASKAQ